MPKKRKRRKQSGEVERAMVGDRAPLFDCDSIPVYRAHHDGGRHRDLVNSLQDLEAVNLRQVDIQEHHVRVFLSDVLEAFLAREAGADQELFLQHHAQCLLGLGLPSMKSSRIMGCYRITALPRGIKKVYSSRTYETKRRGKVFQRSYQSR